MIARPVLLIQLVGKIWLEWEVYAPIGVAYLEASLRAAGYSVHTEVLGPEKSQHSPWHALRTQPGLIGISCTGNEIRQLKHISQVLRRQFPTTPIVVGGYCSLAGKKLFPNSAIDIVAVGEGEETICELANLFIAHSDHSPASLGGIRGILYRAADGRIINTPPRTPTSDLDLLAPPSYDHIPSNSGLVRVYASRGCPFECSFCRIKDFYGSKRIRFHSADYIKAVIVNLIQRSRKHVETVYFNDDEFLLAPRHLAGMATVARDLGLRICFQTRTQDVIRHRRVLAANKDIIDQVHLGVESFSQTQLDRWQKGTTVAENSLALRYLADLGISYYPYLILSDAFTTLIELEDTCAGILDLPACPYPVSIDGITARGVLSPVHSGVDFGRMKKFNGGVERAPTKSYLEAVWTYLRSSQGEAKRLNGICRHATAIDPFQARMLPAKHHLDERIRMIPQIARLAKRNSSFGATSVRAAADRFNARSREIRVDYMSHVITGQT
jgi:pyruvate-formate lyase-activating enzyme